MAKSNVDLVAELEKLAKLHQDGLLTEAEFSKAKSKLLDSGSGSSAAGDARLMTPSASSSASQHRSSFPSQLNQLHSSDEIGRAANRWVTSQNVMAVVAVILFCIFGLFTCSRMDAQQKRMDQRFNNFPNFNR